MKAASAICERAKKDPSNLRHLFTRSWQLHAMLHDMDAKTAETGAAPAEIAAAAVAPIHGDAGMPSGCLVLVGADGAITL